jgi:Plasma-membrane choline transporter
VLLFLLTCDDVQFDNHPFKNKVYVGLYGFSFMEAGKSVITLFQNRGWTAIVADFMTDTVLMMVSFGVGALTALVTVLVGSLIGGDSVILTIAALLGFLLGYGMAATLFSVVSSAVNTVIVCYAESPNEFEANHAALSRAMRDAWREAWPNDFRY